MSKPARSSKPTRAIRRLTPNDLLAITVIEDPQLSPDGAQLAYVQVKIDRESYEYRRTIWLVATSGDGAPRRFTSGQNDTTPRWSPDGRSLAFLRAPASEVKPATIAERANGKGKPQVWVMPTDGGEARRLTTLRHGAGAPVWSPDGATLLLASQVGEPDDHEVDDAALASDGAKHWPRVRTIDRLWYKYDSVGYIYELRAHLFSVAVATGETRQLTEGDYDDGAPAWSPDGQRIAFTSDRSDDRWRWPAPGVWTLDLASGALTRLTDESLACAGPAWSPDGASVAFLASPRRHGVGHTDLYVTSATTAGGARLLTQDFIPTCEDTGIDDMRSFHGGAHLVWAPDGREIFFAGSMRGATHVFATRPTGGLLPRRITDGERRHYGFSFDATGQTLALAISTPISPNDLYIQTVPTAAAKADANAEPQRLTAVNAALFGEIVLAQPEEFAFRGADGWDLQGWVMRPPHLAAGELAPTVLEIHGGPAAMYGYSFFFEFQLLAARGYTVVYSNPRGSTGYGRVFSGAVINDWGGKDYEDVLAGLDAAIARGGVDEARLGVAGGSYGGFMTNWAVGHSDRFKAGVTMRSVVNMATMFGVSDVGWGLVIDELSATPWGDLDRLMRFSPITYVEDINTPLLILHSDNDLRCPVEEAEQLFSALKYLERETKLVRFEGQSHELSRSGHPRSRVIRLREIVGWFERYMPVE